jgi:hypothetical protein
MTMIFFALFGSMFLVTQYLQNVLGYSASRPASACCRWPVSW